MNPESHTPPLPLSLAADLQDHLIVACNDLDRLQVLLADAGSVLLESYRGASELLDAQLQVDSNPVLAAALLPVQLRLGDAVSALQFQDMTSQLIQHTERRLRNCADRLACEMMKDDEGEAVIEPAPLRPNPVTQSEMDVGSIELF